MKTKYIFTIGLLAIALTSCSNNGSQQVEDNAQPVDTVKATAQVVSHVEGSVNNVLLLKSDERLFQSFFDAIDKWNADKGIEQTADSIFANITKPLLKDFLNSIDEQAFATEGEFDKTYEFNRYPQEYKTNKKCPDVVRIEYRQDTRQYYLTVENSFYVEDFGCSEHDTIYIFEIKNHKIEIKDIAAAG